MGQSQLLIIMLSVLLIGIAILVAVGFFRSGDVDANKKAMINSMNQIAHQAVQYFARPTPLGGGNHSFVGFELPSKFASDLNGRYSAVVLGPTSIQISGVSLRDSNNTMTAQIDSEGKAGNWTFTGDFH